MLTLQLWLVYYISTSRQRVVMAHNVSVSDDGLAMLRPRLPVLTLRVVLIFT